MIKAHFVCKPQTMEDIPTTQRSIEPFEIMDIRIMNDEEWNDLSESISERREWLETFSQTARRARWYNGSNIRPCILIIHAEGKHRALLIDTQGHGYPRYVAYVPET